MGKRKGRLRTSAPDTPKGKMLRIRHAVHGWASGAHANLRLLAEQPEWRQRFTDGELSLFDEALQRFRDLLDEWDVNTERVKEAFKGEG